MESASASTSTELSPHPDEDLAAMGFVDVDQNPNIAVFLDMVNKVSLATQPQQVMRHFTAAMRQAYGDSALITISCRGLKPGQFKITRQIGYDNVNLAPTADPWNDGELLKTHTGGFLGRVIATPNAKLSRRLDVTDDPILGDWLAEFSSMIAIPAFVEGTATNWALIFKREADAFSLRDLEEHILRANLIGATVHNVVASNRLRELNERMQDEVERIANIQRALLPKKLPKITGLDISASYQTYDRAGGDMYDFVCVERQRDECHKPAPDPDARWVLMIGDVSGHGPSAAVVMAMLNAILYAYPKTPEGPGELLRYANRHLFAKRIEQNFVTAFMAIYDPPTRRLTYARAGHPPALLKSPDKPLRRLEGEGGLPLGVLEDVEYADVSIELEPGQTLVLYTDGITESMDPDEREFGIEGIENALVDCSGDPDCVVQSIRDDLRDHEAGKRPADDQTIVAIQLVG